MIRYWQSAVGLCLLVGCDDPSNPSHVNPEAGALPRDSGSLETGTDASIVSDAPSLDANSNVVHGPLRVSSEGRHLVHRDGHPFFWLGDTAWFLGAKLTHSEIDEYLAKRHEQGFDVIQTVAAFGMTSNMKNASGHAPLSSQELPEGLNDAYYQTVDYILDKAHEHNLYVALVPDWAQETIGSGLVTTANARAYGRWLGNRWKTRENLVWVLGGDLDPSGKEAVFNELAAGILEETQGSQLMSYHPNGCASSSTWFHQETWLTLNMFQSSHGQRDLAVYQYSEADWNRSPTKPTVNGEPCYDEIPVGFNLSNGRFDANDVRQQAYWSLFAGTTGHTYGHNSVWQMHRDGDQAMNDANMTWREGLDAPSAGQMSHVRALMESRPLLQRVPNQAVLVDALSGVDHLQALQIGDSSVMVYSPTGRPIRVRLSSLKGPTAKAYWFDPRSGSASSLGDFPVDREQEFTPPGSGRGHDWVLVLDSAAYSYPLPGT